MKLKFVVVFLQMPNNYCAYLPDLPGCVSTGKTWEDIQANIREAVTGHVGTMLEYGDPLPEKPMSLEEAITHHNEPLTVEEEKTLADLGDALPTLSTTFSMVEVEVNPLTVTLGR